MAVDFSDGPHDYEGSVAGHISVWHLVRHGSSVEGVSVRDASVGSPGGTEAVVTGSVGDDGTILLTEQRAGAGTLRLRVADGALTGTWSGTTKSKASEVYLSATDPWVTSAGRRALDCLEDVSCSAAEVERLFLAADDAREDTEECFRFLDGAGPKRDAMRGRACLERELARWGGCGRGSSAGFTDAQLATLWIDGVGGAVCIAEARALFADCYDDLCLTRREGGSSPPPAKRTRATRIPLVRSLPRSTSRAPCAR